ncbi:MAG: N-acetyl sugar amidotransferase [Verrucomicrobiota bacterium]
MSTFTSTTPNRLVPSPTLGHDMPYRQCSLSVLDTYDDPTLRFDENGVCHYYQDYKRAEAEGVFTGEEGEHRFNAVVAQIKADGAGRSYDCIMGVSGGVDSTYIAYLAHQHGLRPLAVHFDNGWNSELAVQNIQNILDKLSIDLHTLVVDWEEFRDLQLAYLKSSVVDIEVASDHAIFATLYRLASKHGIKHILNGNNIVTEHVLPKHWIFPKGDHVNLLAIHKAYGTLLLKTYPLFDYRVKKYIQKVQRVQSHTILNMVPYHKATVKKVIQKELGWTDYGGKHYESIWTRFYQGHILPTKFGIDKRKAHLANLIFSGQISKEAALEELKEPIYPQEIFAQDYEFVLKKLNLTESEWQEMMRNPPRSHYDFEYERPLYDRKPWLKPLRPLARFAEKLLSRKA